jgi:hypothetical protein
MRKAETYRGARRNYCLRELGTTWGHPRFYHPKFKPNHIRHTVLSREPSRYHPLDTAGRHLRLLGKRWVGAVKHAMTPKARRRLQPA